MVFLKTLFAILYNPLDYIQKVNLKSLIQMDLRFVFLFLAMLSPGLVHAQDLFTIPSQDISIKVLNAMFGGLVDKPGIGFPNNPILEPLKALNEGALIVGGILASYTILAGTVGTAHDGEMLGKKLSSVWVPIRYSIGTALVLPIIAGGYCVIQWLVMWVVVQGIGLAGTVWTAYLGSMGSMNSAMLPDKKQTAQIIDISFQVLKAQLCVDIMNHLDSMVTNNFKSADPVEKKWGTTGTTNGSIKWGGLKSSYQQGACGEFLPPTIRTATGVGSFSFAPSAGVSTTAAPTTTMAGYLGNINTAFAPIDVTPILRLHKTQMALIVNGVEPISLAIMNDKDFTIADSLAVGTSVRSLGETYFQGLKDAAVAMQDSAAFQKMKDQASEQGWMLAGGWFTRIIMVNNAIRVAMLSYPTFNSTEFVHTIQGAGRARQRDAAAFFSKIVLLNKTFDTISAEQNNTESTGLMERMKSESNDSAQTSAGFVDSAVRWLSSKFVNTLSHIFLSIDMEELQNDTRHPIIMLNDMGSRLSTSVFVATLAVAAIGAATGAGAMVALTAFFQMPLQAIIVIALTAEFVVPNLPYMIWIGCIVGWSLLVVEAIIAAPLWAIMHLHPNGDDLTGKGGNGYSLVLSLIFRPTLMIFGLIAAMLISSIIGEFINKTFFSVFMNSLRDISGIGYFLAMLMSVFLYVSLMFTFTKQCYGIIHKLPDQLMRWMGGSTGGLGEMAAGFQDSAEKSATGAAMMGAAVTSKVATGTGQLANKANDSFGIGKSNINDASGSEGAKFGENGPSTKQKFAMGLSNALNGKKNGYSKSETKGEDGKTRATYHNAAGREESAKLNFEKKAHNVKFGGTPTTPGNTGSQAGNALGGNSGAPDPSDPGDGSQPLSNPVSNSATDNYITDDGLQNALDKIDQAQFAKGGTREMQERSAVFSPVTNNVSKVAGGNAKVKSNINQSIMSKYAASASESHKNHNGNAGNALVNISNTEISDQLKSEYAARSSNAENVFANLMNDIHSGTDTNGKTANGTIDIDYIRNRMKDID